jgi:hypothetical protein
MHFGEGNHEAVSSQPSAVSQNRVVGLRQSGKEREQPLDNVAPEQGTPSHAGDPAIRSKKLTG